MTPPSVERIVVGLGNPGPEYEWTRHNVGFHVVERIAHEKGALFRSARRLDGYRGPTRFQWARLESPAALLIKPETFMNLSGEVVAPLARFVAEGAARPDEPAAAGTEGAAGTEATARAQDPMGEPGAVEAEDAPADVGAESLASRVLVVYDDLDLDLGRLRIRPGGSAGGQRGMRNIIEHLGTPKVPRIRVGIGRPGTDAVRYVLQRFPKDEQVEIEISIAEAAEAALDWLASGDLEACMARFHNRWNQGS